jgi:hypothetical protein
MYVHVRMYLGAYLLIWKHERLFVSVHTEGERR